MASNIPTNGTFAVTNLKPDPGEQADALWAQKMAENTGFVFGRPMGWLNGFGTTGTYKSAGPADFGLNARFETYFFRPAGHNKFAGTYTSVGTFENPDAPDTYYSDGFSIKGDSGQYDLYFTATTANIGAPQIWGSTHAFTVDLAAYVPENSWGTMIGTFWGSSLDSGLTRSIRYDFGTPAIGITYWG